MSRTSQSECLHPTPLAGALLPATLLSRQRSWHPSFHAGSRTHVCARQYLATMCVEGKGTRGPQCDTATNTFRCDLRFAGSCRYYNPTVASYKGTSQDYIESYSAAAAAMLAADPNIVFGGMAVANQVAHNPTFPKQPNNEDTLLAAAESGLPMDFFSYHSITSMPGIDQTQVRASLACRPQLWRWVYSCGAAGCVRLLQILLESEGTSANAVLGALVHACLSASRDTSNPTRHKRTS